MAPFTFEVNGVYDVDDMFAPRLLRTGKFIPAKEPKPVRADDDLAVGQPEAPRAPKPVATVVKPLPETDDLVKYQVVKSVIKPKRKPKGKKK
jgi:hypothetical protein